jgi:hypothetical protein
MFASLPAQFVAENRVGALIEVKLLDFSPLAPSPPATVTNEAPPRLRRDPLTPVQRNVEDAGEAARGGQGRQCSEFVCGPTPS